jgi:glutamate formiminotransferase
VLSKQTWTAINISSSSELLKQEILNQSDPHIFQKVRLESDSIYNRMVLSLMGPLEKILNIIESLAPLIISHIDLSHHKGVHFRMGAIDVIPFISLQEPFDELEILRIQKFAKAISKWIPIYYYGALATSNERRRLSNIRQTGLENLIKRIHNFPPDLGSIKTIHRTGACALGIRGPMIAFNMRIQTNSYKGLNQYVRSLSEKNHGIKGIMSAVFKIDKDHYDASFNIILNPLNSLYNLYLKMALYLKVNNGTLIHSTIIGFIQEKELFHGFEPDISLEAIKQYYQLKEFEKSQIIKEDNS